MDLLKAEEELGLLINELEVLENFYIKYGDEIRFAEDAVLYSSEDKTEFLIQWQRTPFSKYKTAEMYNSGDFYSLRNYLINNCEDVVCCTPESVYGFIDTAVNSMKNKVMNKKYNLYKKKLEVYENAFNNRHQGER